MDLEHTHLGPLVDLARKSLGSEVIAIKRPRDGDVPALIVDKGREVKSAKEIVDAFEKTQDAPYRRRGTYKAADVASLMGWMDKHCGDEAPVFGTGAENLASEWAGPKLALVGIGNYSDGAKAAWHDFSGRYDFPVTKQWTDWTQNSIPFREARGKGLMSQGEFAEFVENHLYEFSEPRGKEDLGEAVTRMIEALGGTKHVGKPTDMYGLARGVAITVKESVEVKLDRSSGQAALTFSEEHKGEGGRPVAIPKFFYIRIPIFFGEEPSLIGVLLRYRNAGGGQVVWGYELFAPDLVVKDAFDRACEIVRKDRTLYLGSPDIPNT